VIEKREGISGGTRIVLNDLDQDLEDRQGNLVRREETPYSKMKACFPDGVRLEVKKNY